MYPGKGPQISAGLMPVSVSAVNEDCISCRKGVISAVIVQDTGTVMDVEEEVGIQMIPSGDVLLSGSKGSGFLQKEQTLKSKGRGSINASSAGNNITMEQRILLVHKVNIIQKVVQKYIILRIRIKIVLFLNCTKEFI